MPFTKRQIQKILDFEGQPVLLPNARDSLAVQVAESFIRRRLFAHEDQTVVAQFTAYRKTWRDLRGMAFELADAAGVGSTLGQDGESLLFRREFTRRARPRLAALATEVARSAFEGATTAWLAGHYGRLWLLDGATQPDVRVTVQPVDMGQVAQDVVQGRLREQIDRDLLLDLLGQEWRDAYALELDDLLTRMQRSLTRSMTDGVGMRDAMRRLADEMGVNIDRRGAVGNPRANFNRVQAITRTSIQDSANRGALASYQRNRDIVEMVEFIETLDDRVCPICDRRQGGLGGRVWRMDDPSMQVPPVHVNCRCTLVPVIDLAQMLADDEPPPMTFGEWVDNLGAAVTLTAAFSAFISGRQTESPRIGFEDDLAFEDF